MIGIGSISFVLAALVAAACAADGPKKYSPELSTLAAETPSGKHMSVWTFVNRMLHELTPTESLGFLNQAESASRYIVLELDKTQNFKYNKIDNTVEQLVPSQNMTSQTRETGDIFQGWLERTFDVAYEWAHNNESESYKEMALDFKAGREYIRGLSKFSRFTDQHVQVVADFYRAYATRPDYGNQSLSTMYQDFKTHVAINAAEEAAAGNNNNNSALIMRVRRAAAISNYDLLDVRDFRGVFSDPRNETGFWGWFWTMIDYHEDAVVFYNRAQLGMWPQKLAISLILPPAKFIWTAVDFGYCLHEEIYELKFAQSTEERWWDVLLCGLELFGVIPGFGPMKFAMRIGIRMIKFYLGIHTVPWYLSGPWQGITSWWNGSSANETVDATTLLTTVATTIMQSISTTTTTTTLRPKPTTAEYNFGDSPSASPFIIGSMSG